MRKQHSILKVLKEKEICQPRIIYSEKILSQTKMKKWLLKIQKLKEFKISRTVLWEMLKEVLQADGDKNMKKNMKNLTWDKNMDLQLITPEIIIT